ncbi:MAG: VOC family protein [Culturomica sp.]|jgi:catechol 2,3-dioxygenase-like lactoylglutathione lyase family enzyme|nr:VOC family protein [Culturomica sp.]
MKFNNVRLLVRDYRKCFEFYTQKLGFEPLWDIENCYGAFKVAVGIEGLAIFLSDYMAPVVGNADRQQPVGGREKSMISFEVENVDETWRELQAKGVSFINEPTDMPGWGIRVVHLRDPEENLIELYTPLQPQ